MTFERINTGESGRSGQRDLGQTSTRDLAFILFKHKWGALAIFLGVVFASGFYVLFIRDDVYTVHTKILIRLGHEQSNPLAGVADTPTPTIIAQRSQDVQSEVDLLANTLLLGRVVDHLGMDRPAPVLEPPDEWIPWFRHHVKRGVKLVQDGYDEILVTVGLRPRLTDREKAIHTIAKGLDVFAHDDSNVIVATLSYPARVGGSLILNTLVNFYQDYRLEVFRDDTAVEFFEAQVQRTGGQLEDSEDLLRGFETTARIADLSKEREALVTMVAEERARLAEAELDLDLAELKVTRLQEELELAEPNFGALGGFDTGSFPESIMLQLAELERMRERLRLTELDGSPRLENNRDQFARLAEMVGANLRAILAEKRATLDRRRETLRGSEQRLARLQEQETELRRLRRDVKSREDSHLFYLRKLEEASANAALEERHIGNAVVIAPATDALAPSGVRKRTLLLLSLPLALLAVMAWITVLEFFDHRIFHGEALESYLDVPVIGVVPAERG